MSRLVSIDTDNVYNFIKEKEVLNLREEVSNYHTKLHEKTGLGNDFLGWVDQALKIDEREIEDIINTANKIKEDSDVLIVIGIGGSYLGAKAGIEFLSNHFSNEINGNLKVYFAGQNISSSYLSDLLEVIENKDVSLNIISKSGTTTEPAIAFRVLKEYMENKYGKEMAAKRIYATTDKERGALKELAIKEGYKTFIVPDDIGGRYSIFTPVGLLPMEAKGINTLKIIEGLKRAFNELNNKEISENDAYKYAVIRNRLYLRGYTNEALVNYEPSLFYIGEWFKQLFGESEGKDGKGILPISLNFTTDLHSMGQYIQDGRKNIFETILNIESKNKDINIKKTEDNIDGLNYLAEKSMDYVNKKAMLGTLKAHVDGGVPNIIINIQKKDEYSFGYLMYFFMKACAMGGYLLGVNPFDQPGVEDYKKNMFEILGKPNS